MEMEKSKVLIQFLLFFRQSGDVLFFLYACRLRGYTATPAFVGNMLYFLESLLVKSIRVYAKTQELFEVFFLKSL